MRHLTDPGTLTPGVVSWLFLLGTMVFLPLGVVLQERQLARAGEFPTRRDIYAGAGVTHALLLAAALFSAREAGLPVLRDLDVSPGDLLVGAAALALGAVTLLDRLTPERARERTEAMAPRTRSEQAMFAGVALSAGVAEEIAYRGVLFALLAHLLGGWWLPALVAAAAFGVVHLFQGWRAALLAAGAGVVAQVVVGLTGTLLVAIAVHLVHDLIAGAVLGRRVRARAAGGSPVAG